MKDINNQEIEAGDVILRALHSDFTRHKVIRITDNGIVVSSIVKKYSILDGSGSSAFYRDDSYEQPIESHNSLLYIPNSRYRHFLILEKDNDTLDVKTLKKAQNI